jgi:hypothetical protein
MTIWSYSKISYSTLDLKDPGEPENRGHGAFVGTENFSQKDKVSDCADRMRRAANNQIDWNAMEAS